tara:strand:- start:2063 stop:2566 length:504 start_codon:yes stop_codon:yes gene_type:complete
MSEYDALKYNTPPTEEEIKQLETQAIFQNPEAGVNELLKLYGYTKPMGPDAINALISANENKDYFELGHKGLAAKLESGVGHQGPWTGSEQLASRLQSGGSFIENILQSLIANKVGDRWENKFSIDDLIRMAGAQQNEEKLIDSLSRHVDTIIPEVGSRRYKENIKK